MSGPHFTQHALREYQNAIFYGFENEVEPEIEEEEEELKYEEKFRGIVISSIGNGFDSNQCAGIKSAEAENQRGRNS